MSHRMFLAAAFLGLAVVPTVGFAADLDYGYGDAPPPEAEQKVEFGSGWYVRGDLGVDQSYAAVTGDLVPGAYPTVDPVRVNRPGYDASLGGGYKFTNGFRADLLIDFQQPITQSRTGASYACPIGVYGTPIGSPPYTGRGFQDTICTPHLSGRLDSYDALANLYYDFAAVGFLNPYLGVGAGVAFGHYHAGVNWFTPNGVAYNFNYTDPVTNAALNVNYDKTTGVSYQHFAFALMAGVTVDIYDHMKLDVGYRYLDLGRIAGEHVYYHQVRAGVRYMLDD